MKKTRDWRDGRLRRRAMTQGERDAELLAIAELDRRHR